MRRRLLEVAGPVTVTVLLLLGLEFGAGLLLPAEVPLEPLRVVGDDDAVSTTLTYLDINLAPLDKDVDLLWRNRPSVMKRQPVNPQRYGHHDEWTIRTSSRGLRGPELSPGSKPEGTLRILCVGDSVTFGFNVDQEDAYPEQLQRLLRERFPGRHVDVINAGTPGWSWVQGVRFLELEGLATQPDVVIMGHGANDRFFPSTTTDQERIGRLRGLGVRWTEAARAVLERTNVYRLVRRWFGPSGEADATLTPACREQMRETGKCRRVGLDEMEAAASAAYHLSRDAGVDLLVLNLDFMETDAVGAVRRAVAREHIPFLDIVAEHRRRQADDEARRARGLGLRPAQRTRLLNGMMAPTRVLFRVLVAGHAESIAVRGRTFTAGTEFSGELRDDGIAGDEIAGDGVWSGRVAVPSDLLLYRFLREGVPEFDALPPLPSAQGFRQRDAAGENVFPVETFGELYLMVEHMHPDAGGQRFIAERILDTLPLLRAFAQWAGEKTT